MWFSPQELRDLKLASRDVVVVEGGAGYGRSAYIASPMEGWGYQNSIIRVRPRPGLSEGRFLNYVFQSLLFTGETALAASVATIPHYTADKVGATRHWMPNVEAQGLIADFLDRETAQIDAMIEAQEELTARIREHHAASRAHAVLPLLLEGARLKKILRESDERARTRAESLPLLSVSVDWGVQRRDESAVNQAASDNLSHYKLAREGDIVLNRMRAFQGALGRAPADGIVSPDYSVFRPRQAVLTEWLSLVMRSGPFVAVMASRIRGIGSVDSGQVRTPRLNARDLLDIRLRIPNTCEQARSLEEWNRTDKQIGDLINSASEVVRLLRERREALITAAVTGRIDPATGVEQTDPATYKEAS